MKISNTIKFQFGNEDFKYYKILVSEMLIKHFQYRTLNFAYSLRCSSHRYLSNR